MPRLVLASSSVAYNLVTLAKALDNNFPESPRVLIIQMPANAQESGNGATDTVKIGSPNSNTTPTDIGTNQTGFLLVTGAAPLVIHDQLGINASAMWLKGTANNVINVMGI